MRRNSGQSIFEVTIAIAVVTVVLVALVSLVATTQRNTNAAKDKAAATRFNQELSEWLRGQRDANWNTFWANTATTSWCFNQTALSWGNTGVCGATEFIPNTAFLREVVFTRSPNSARAEITVYWNDSQGRHEVRTTHYFTNWRGQ